MCGAVCAERITMKKIEPKTRFVVQLLSVYGDWRDYASFTMLSWANRKKHEFENDEPKFKFRIVRATTTYEVMEETK